MANRNPFINEAGPIQDDDLFIIDQVDGTNSAAASVVRTYMGGGDPYVLPVASTVLGGVKAGGTNITIASDGTISASLSGGGLTAANFVFNETPSGVINGSNTIFTLAHTPTLGTVTLYKMGQFLAPGIDYTISGSQITYTIPPNNIDYTDVLIANYLK